MKSIFIISLLLLSVSLSLSILTTQVHFHGYSVLRYILTDQSQLSFITDLQLDVWSEGPVIGENDIMVSPLEKQLLLAKGIVPQSVMIEDVEKLLEDERNTINAAQPSADWFTAYHNIDEIYSFYRNLTAAFPKTKLVPSIGKSLEGRDLIGFIFGSEAPKKRIYFQAGQHAREWVSHTTAAFIIDSLLNQYGKDTLVTELLDNVQFVVVPVVNVDGYVFTWASNRLWRKNRRTNSNGSYGVDLNRNWDDHWGGEGSSSNPSSDTYHGTAPFSEPESKSAAAFFTEHGPYDGAIDWHSYSQLILRPYGWTTALPPNDAVAKIVGDGVRDQIRATHGVSYTSEPSWQLYYTSGTAQDWFYAPGKTPLAYTIELRDTGSYGFQLPPAQIIPTGEENLAGFKFFANYILKNTN